MSKNYSRNIKSLIYFNCKQLIFATASVYIHMYVDPITVISFKYSSENSHI